MPLKKCSKDGVQGWKWGDQGHCYPGKEGKKKAIKQGIVIEGPEKFKEIMKSGGSLTEEEDILNDEELDSLLTDLGYSIIERAMYLYTKDK